jgi:glycosyltransferase involved in cell wall biosynthesis
VSGATGGSVGGGARETLRRVAAAGRRGGRRAPHHIVFLVENLSVPLDRRVWNECLTLTAAGYEVSVVCIQGKRHDSELSTTIDGVRILRYPLPILDVGLAGYVWEYGYALSATLARMTELWREHPFDVVHACNPPDLLFLPSWPYRRRGVAFVYDQHDAVPEIMIAKRGGEVRDGLPERVVHWAERRTFKAADVVISPNDSYREIAFRRGGRAHDDVFVVRSAPRLDEFALGELEPFDRRGHKHLVGYLGVMGRQDGVDVLLRATAQLVERGYDILLYLAGSGEMFDELKRLVADLRLRDRVLMPGFQSPAQFTPILRNADVCVAPDPPSPFNDISTMNKVIEYMALARPCVSFDLRENRVTGGDVAVFADEPTPEGLAAAIAPLLDDDALRDRLGRAGRERFETQLSWEQSGPPLLAAYERLAEKVGASETR